MRANHLFTLVSLSALCMVAAGAAIWVSVGDPELPAWLEDRPALQKPNAPPPPPEIFKFKEGIAAADAEAINDAVPASTDPIIPAKPLLIVAGRAQSLDQLSAIDCLTAAVYYEAASETPIGQRAVAQVVLNRVLHPAYPNSICGVVFQGSSRQTGCQFSFTCDGSLARRPATYAWARARQVAAMSLSGYVEPSVGHATHYHTKWVVPYWSSSLSKMGTIGAHIFYRWKGRNGTRQAFTNNYAATEALPDSLSANLKGFLLTDAANGGLADVIDPGGLAISSSVAPVIDATSLVGSNNEKLLGTSDTLIEASVKKNNLLIDEKVPALKEEKSKLVVDKM